MANDSLNRTPRRIRGSFLLLAILAAWSWTRLAQADAAQGIAPAAKAKPAVKASPPAQSPAKKASAPAKSAQQPKKVAGKRTPAKPSAGAKPAATTKAAPAVLARRDPFKIPPPAAPGALAGGAEVTGPLPPGTRGLVVGQLKLEGIVRLDTTNMMIAVVTNYTNRAYFLRENDMVYNGVVSKITPDSVSFKENFLDANGRTSSREVVKRLGPAPGEGR